MLLRLDDEKAALAGHPVAARASASPTAANLPVLAPLAIVAAFALLVWAAPGVRGAEIGWIAIGHLAWSSTAALTGAILVLSIHLLVKAARGGPLEPPGAIMARFVKARWQGDRLVSMLMPPLYLSILLSAFSTFKQRILPRAGFGMDPVFAEADRLLLFGFDGWELTLGLFGTVAVTQAIDWAYMLWFVPMTMLPLLSWLLPPLLRTQTLLAYALTWILIGGVAAFALPSAGPVYYEQFHGGHAGFAEMNAALARLDAEIMAGGGEGLLALKGQAALLLTYRTGELMMAGGISAMPSMHNALAVLFALVAFRVHRGVGFAFAAYAGIIFLGSVHLGWHYALDGIVALALVIPIWRISGGIARRLRAST